MRDGQQMALYVGLKPLQLVRSKEVKKSTQQSKLRAVPFLYLGSAVLGSLKFCDPNFFSFCR